MIGRAREMKARLDEVQKELADITVEGSAGKGAVKVIMDGQQNIRSVKISPQVASPDKVEELETLVLKAVADATARSQKVAGKRLGKLTGGLKIPGLF